MMNHNHGQNHDHDHDHHNNHGGHQHDSKTADSDICIIENRDSEANSKLEKSVVVNHVWETCKPESQFTVKSPTVSARRIQLMRAQLQQKEWDNEPVSEQASQMECAKSNKPKGRCQCGVRNSDNAKNSYSTTSSISDVMHACPDECAETDATDVEEEQNDICNY